MVNLETTVNMSLIVPRRVLAFAVLALLQLGLGYTRTSATADGSSVATRPKNHGYRDVVQRIIKDGIEKWPNFRTIAAYNHVVTQLPPALGQHMLETATAVDGALVASDAFVRAATDHARLGGGPVVPLRGMRVPTTLWRYIRVYADLRNLFGAESDFDTNVAEVGVGYGAQCDVVQRLGAMLAPSGASAHTRMYTLCDLPEVEELAEQYLRAIRGSSATDLPALGKLNSNPNSTNSCASTSGNYSLFISNYAFSELNSDVQQIYWDQVIRCSRRGYVTMNAFNGISSLEFVAKLRASGKHDATVMDSYPGQCRAQNVNTAVVVWGATADRVDSVEKAALSTPGLQRRQAQMEQRCIQFHRRACATSKGRKSPGGKTACDYGARMTARQWRDHDPR